MIVMPQDERNYEVYDFAEVPNGDFGRGPPLTLKAVNGRVLVYRAGKLVGFCADGKCVRLADDD